MSYDEAKQAALVTLSPRLGALYKRKDGLCLRVEERIGFNVEGRIGRILGAEHFQPLPDKHFCLKLRAFWFLLNQRTLEVL